MKYSCAFCRRTGAPTNVVEPTEPSEADISVLAVGLRALCGRDDDRPPRLWVAIARAAWKRGAR